MNTNKKHLITKISTLTGSSITQTEQLLNAFIHTVSDELAKGNNVAISGFGTFRVRALSARKGRNPSTGAELQIAASKSISFKTGKALKETINS